MTEIIWSARYLREEKPIVERALTPCPTWWVHAPHSTSSAEALAEFFFDSTGWAAHVGSEDTCATIELEIHSPATIAGTYRVALERRTKAHAERIVEPPPKTAPMFAETGGV